MPEDNSLTTSKVIRPEVLAPENVICPPNESQLEPPLNAATLSDILLRNGLKLLPEAIREVFEAGLEIGKYSPKERLKGKQFQWLIEQIPLIFKKLDELLVALPAEEQPEAADFAATIEAAVEASQKTADAKKRRLLRNAVVNAFDPKQYQAGLTLRLFSILKDIEYGDVELLATLEEKGGTTQVRELPGSSLGGLMTHHLEVLSSLGLVLIWNQDRGAPLGVNPGSAHTAVTDLGKRFLEFVAEPNVDELEEANASSK